MATSGDMTALSAVIIDMRRIRDRPRSSPIAVLILFETARARFFRGDVVVEIGELASPAAEPIATLLRPWYDDVTSIRLPSTGELHPDGTPNSFEMALGNPPVSGDKSFDVAFTVYLLLFRRRPAERGDEGDGDSNAPPAPPVDSGNVTIGDGMPPAGL